MDKKENAGDVFIKYLSDTFKSDLEKAGMGMAQFYSKCAMPVSYPTFRRIIIGEGSIGAYAIAQVADLFGYELKLVPKSETKKETENEDNN